VGFVDRTKVALQISTYNRGCLNTEVDILHSYHNIVEAVPLVVHGAPTMTVLLLASLEPWQHFPR
jgi:hypothetical protein